ncbi:DNA-directed RNA polymerase subunit omega [bacterium]|nr:MAG: DNA-directed RNA polymerase subunit omega [bacterium]
MPVKAFPFDKLDEKIENVYEAVIIAARRARQINDEQMIQVRTLMEGEDAEDDEAPRINREDILDLEKLPKPVATALKELLDQKLEHEYLDKEEK